MELIVRQAQHIHTVPHKELPVRERWLQCLEGLKLYILSNDSQCLIDGVSVETA